MNIDGTPVKRFNPDRPVLPAGKGFKKRFAFGYFAPSALMGAVSI